MTNIQSSNLVNRVWQGIPGIERTAGGRLFLSWFTGGPKEPAPGNTVLLCHSDDDGKTFSEPVAMGLPWRDGTRCFDPNLWIDPGGRLWYILNRGNKDTAQHDVWARLCDEPDAEKPVFGDEFRIDLKAPYAFRINKPTVLSSGEWVMPVTHAAEAIHGWCAGPKQLQGVAFSADEGKTWTLHGGVHAPHWALECMVTELTDGRLWMLIRTGDGFLWESYSEDKGRTWSEGRASSIANPGSRFFIRRLSSRNLLLVNHYKFTGRSHLTAQLSTDDGRTWNDGLLLDERDGVSYPDGVQDEDGVIWITYDRDRGGAGEILLAKFKEDDVGAGRNISGAVSLKQILNKLDKPNLLPSDWDPVQAGERVLADLNNICLSRVKGAHDSDFVIIDGRAYVVYMANDVQPGENPNWAFVYNALSVVDVATGAVESTETFAASGMKFANEALPEGACFVPRVLRKDATTLRCFFASEDPGNRQSQTWYRDFDLATGCFAPDIHRAEIETGGGVFPMRPQVLYRDAAARGFQHRALDYGLYPIDGFKHFDGRIYAVLNNFPGKQNAWSVLNDSLDRFTVLGHYFEPLDAQLSESAVNRLPDGSWLAISRQDGRDCNYMFATSADGCTWSPHECRDHVVNGTNSKPIFECYNGTYYLGWNEATRIDGAFRSVFNLDVSRDGKSWQRKYRFETSNSFQYPTLCEWDGTIYLSVTQGDHSDSRKERIMFGKLEDVQ
jgi:predicted neuraminidase